MSDALDSLALDALILRAERAAKRDAFEAARLDYETALSRLGPYGPHVTVRSGLGWVVQQLGDHETALAHYDAALAEQLRTGPADRARLDTLRQLIAGVLTALGRHGEALAFWRLMLETETGPSRHVLLQRASEAALSAGQDQDAARLRDEGLDCLRARLPATGAMLGASLTNLGMEAARGGRLGEAETWLREAITTLPGLGYATQTLINVFLRQDRMREAREIAVRHYGRKSFWERRRKGGRATLLTVISLHGNTPEQHLLARLGFDLIMWQIEFGPEAEASLPAYDLVLTQMADADYAQAALERAADFTSRCEKPVINDPIRLGRTRRDLIPRLLEGIDGLVVPKIARFDAAARAEDAIETAKRLGFGLPVILRAAGRHGGSGLALCADLDEMARDWNDLGERDGTYLTEYVDYRSADGFFRKYRVIFVDRRPFPYHLAISPHWLVHYFSAGMEAHSWKLEEELRFLGGMDARLGQTAAAAIREVGRRMDLDYCGIDFSLLPDGRVLLFEANATMLVHPEAEDGPLAAKNFHVDRILQAFETLVLSALPA